MAVNPTVAAVMNATNNYFAVLCERVKGAQIDGRRVSAAFEGKYTNGMLLRVHGAFSGSYGDFGAGELYEVVSFDGETLELDHELHTIAPWLFIVYCEPTAEFLALCEKIDAYAETETARRGLQSESIDGYSWSAGNGGASYESAFADDLARYRQPRPTTLYYARLCTQWQ